MDARTIQINQPATLLRIKQNVVRIEIGMLQAHAMKARNQTARSLPRRIPSISKRGQ